MRVKGGEDIKKNIEAKLARELLISKVHKMDIEKVAIGNSANRILAREVVAYNNIPNFRRSPLDGYALSAKDTKDIGNGEKTFKVIGYIGAGDSFTGKVEKNTAIRIMTGAPIPDGYNCVIRMEDVDSTDEEVTIYTELIEGENLVNIGEDIKKGDKLLEPGKRITPGAIGVMVSLGVEEIEVYRKPRVGILSTGNELVELGQKLEGGKIYNSNFYTLKATIENIGVDVVDLGISKDKVDEIIDVIEKNIEDIDMIITTGGASVGDYDLIPLVYEKLEAEFLFWRVKMKPGTPMLASYYRGKLLIGLSGNPGAAMISFEEVVNPVLRAYKGETDYNKRVVKATLMNDFNKKSKQRRLLRAVFRIEDDGNKVYISENQRPGVLTSMIDCNSFIDVEENTPYLKKGDIVDVIL